MTEPGAVSDVERFGDALHETGRLVYRNSHLLAAVSLCWALVSFPVVTVGPATLGAYVAIGQIASDRNRIELGDIFVTVRRQFVPATLFGLLPGVFFLIAGGYAVAQPVEPSLRTVLPLFLSLYAGLYAVLVLVPTFVELAVGTAPSDALRAGVGWTATHPTLAMLAGIFTAVVLVVSLALMVTFPLLYAGLAFSFHWSIVDHDNSAAVFC